MWTILLHPLILSEDLKILDPPVRGKILAALHKRLAQDPKSYGGPLRGEPAGLWKLRAGEYRVIYRILEGRVEVLVLKVGVRRDFEVYRQMLLRLRRV